MLLLDDARWYVQRFRTRRHMRGGAMSAAGPLAPVVARVLDAPSVTPSGGHPLAFIERHRRALLKDGDEEGRRGARASKSETWGRFLHELVREFRPLTVVEMGTAVGVSGAYLATALRDNGAGRLWSFEGAVRRVEIARAFFDGAGLGGIATVTHGRFRKTLMPACRKIAPIDMVFIDGHHDGEATRSYFEAFRPLLSDGAIVIFDDISWSPGMKSAWQAIRATPDLRWTADLRTVGIVAV